MTPRMPCVNAIWHSYLDLQPGEPCRCGQRVLCDGCDEVHTVVELCPRCADSGQERLPGVE